jgi:hypothetical protein
VAQLRRRWQDDLALPWDVDKLRAWLAVEVSSGSVADLDDGGRPAHELMKAAIVDGIRAVLICRERGLPGLSAERPIRTLIPRTSMLERYLTMQRSQKMRLSIAEVDDADPAILIKDFGESVARFQPYANVDEPFHDDDRAAPVAGSGLWKTNDITGRMIDMGELKLQGRVTRGKSEEVLSDLGLSYVDREIIAARTAATPPTQFLQRVALVRHDLLMRSLDGDLPVLGEIKMPADKDAYYALIQLLAAASQLVTPDQHQRLRKQEPDAGFVGATDEPRVDLALVIVDPNRCGQPVEPTKTEQPYQPKFDAIAPRIARLILEQDGIGDYVRRIFRVDVRLDDDGQLHGEVSWAFRPTWHGPDRGFRCPSVRIRTRLAA